MYHGILFPGRVSPCHRAPFQVIADSDEGSDKEDDRADLAPKRRRAIIASLFSKYSKPQHLMFG